MRWATYLGDMLPNFINSAFGKADCWDNPFTAATLHALPGILAHVCTTLWALETTFQFAQFKLWTHPRQWIQEMVGAVSRCRYCRLPLSLVVDCWGDLV